MCHNKSSCGFEVSFLVLKVHQCVCLLVFLHETLQLPWLEDKRVDYAAWHPLGWRCLNIVQPKSDPELPSFILLSSLLPPLSLSLLCLFSFLVS